MMPKVNRPILKSPLSQQRPQTEHGSSGRRISPLPMSRSESPPEQVWSSNSRNLNDLRMRTTSGPHSFDTSPAGPAESAQTLQNGAPAAPLNVHGGPGIQSMNESGNGNLLSGHVPPLLLETHRQGSHPVGSITSLADLGRMSLLNGNESRAS
jgi:hypothetical protein